MTLAMPDSIRVGDLPPGYPAYLGYADGKWPTAQALAERFPQAHRVILTVTGTHFEADGIDCEPGNPTAADGAYWASIKLQHDQASRPVLYASVTGTTGYGMGDVLRDLSGLGIDRSRVRLLAAHYGAGEHICGPRTCGQVGTDMDGTQWTDAWQDTDHGPAIDMSALRDDFFTGSTGLNWSVRLMQQLPIVRQGSAPMAVARVQGLLVARGHDIGNSGPHADGIDGVFGPETASAVRVMQSQARIAVDGVVGPQTWPVLLGIAP